MSTVERRRRRTLGQQVRVILPIFLVWSVGFVVLVFVGTRDDMTSSAMLLDPTFTPGLSWYTGMVSNLGVLAWTTAVVAAVSGAWICKLGARPRAGRFLRHGALVGAVLLLDDLFQLHAIAVPTWLGVEKIVPLTFMAGGAVAWIAVHRREILRTHVHVLGAAAVGLGLSLVIDTIVGPAPGESGLIFEDGAKFLGALAWATYFVITTRDICRSVFTDALMVWPDEVIAELRRQDDPADGPSEAPRTVADPVEDAMPSLDVPDDAADLVGSSLPEPA